MEVNNTGIIASASSQPCPSQGPNPTPYQSQNLVTFSDDFLKSQYIMIAAELCRRKIRLGPDRPETHRLTEDRTDQSVPRNRALQEWHKKTQAQTRLSSTGQTSILPSPILTLSTPPISLAQPHGQQPPTRHQQIHQVSQPQRPVPPPTVQIHNPPTTSSSGQPPTLQTTVSALGHLPAQTPRTTDNNTVPDQISVQLRSRTEESTYQSTSQPAPPTNHPGYPYRLHPQHELELATLHDNITNHAPVSYTHITNIRLEPPFPESGEHSREGDAPENEEETGITETRHGFKTEPMAGNEQESIAYHDDLDDIRSMIKVERPD